MIFSEKEDLKDSKNGILWIIVVSIIPVQGLIFEQGNNLKPIFTIVLSIIDEQDMLERLRIRK
jgi:hypothetical protein